MTLIYFILPLG